MAVIGRRGQRERAAHTAPENSQQRRRGAPNDSDMCKHARRALWACQSLATEFGCGTGQSVDIEVSREIPSNLHQAQRGSKGGGVDANDLERRGPARKAPQGGRARMGNCGIGMDAARRPIYSLAPRGRRQATSAPRRARQSRRAAGLDLEESAAKGWLNAWLNLLQRPRVKQWQQWCVREGGPCKPPPGAPGTRQVPRGAGWPGSIC